MTSTTTYTPVPDAEATSLIGEGLHTGLRKGSEDPASGPLWRAIHESGQAWDDALDFLVWGLGVSGCRLCKVEPGHLYLSRERIAELRKLAMNGPSDETVGIERRTLLELICDWKNLQPDFEELPDGGPQHG